MMKKNLPLILLIVVILPICMPCAAMECGSEDETLQEELYALSFFNDRFAAADEKESEYDDDVSKALTVWEEEERVAENLTFDSPIMQQYHAQYKNDVSERKQKLMDLVRDQQRTQASHFFAVRADAVIDQEKKYPGNFDYLLSIWEAEEQAVQACSLDAPFMQEEYGVYRGTLQRYIGMLRIHLQRAHNARAMQDVIDLTKSGKLEQAQHALHQVPDQEDGEFLAGYIAHHDEKFRDQGGESSAERAVEHQHDPVLAQSVHGDQNQGGQPPTNSMLKDVLLLGMVPGTLYSFYTLFQWIRADDPINMHAIESCIATFDEQSMSDQDRAHQLLYQLACQIVRCIDTTTDTEKVLTLKEIRARIIALTAQPVTRDQLIEIVHMIKSTVA